MGIIKAKRGKKSWSARCILCSSKRMSCVWARPLPVTRSLYYRGNTGRSQQEASLILLICSKCIGIDHSCPTGITVRLLGEKQGENPAYGEVTEGMTFPKLYYNLWQSQDLSPFPLAVLNHPLSKCPSVTVLAKLLFWRALGSASEVTSVQFLSSSPPHPLSLAWKLLFINLLKLACSGRRSRNTQHTD